ncbi:MAG TPA: hypothetical protein VL993_04150 [Stellaceae bacterium]|nr:hypothetical protein [Stellaceae bacterium]
MAEHEVHLVGSVPLASAADVFETVAGALGDLAPRIPDGETGPRQGWVRSFDPIFGGNPALVRTAEEFRPHATGGATLRYRPRDGIKPEDVKFADLPHAALAAAAWRDFRALKDAGKIPAKTRYLFTIPHPIPLVRRYFAPELQDAIEPALEAAMYAEIGKVCAAIPHADLAIQWDCASAVFFTLEKGEPSRFGRTRDEMYRPIAERLARAGRAVPAGVELAYHFCYGNSGGRHSIEPSSTRDAVAMANAVSAALSRDIQMIHTPVPIDRDDDAYFAPLDRLEVRPGTGISLGLIHLSDGVEGARRRMTAAKKHLPRFSVGTECGLSCVPPERLGAMLRLHADVAALA